MERKNVIKNFIWRYGEICGAQLVAMLVGIVLARLLDPDAYGTIAIIYVFTSILSVFVTNGLGNALIQKKDPDDLDYSTVFYANAALCITLYTLLFFCAPLIAKFYNRVELIPMIRVLGTTILISIVKNIQCSYAAKNMLFKKFFFATIGGTIGSAVVGITLAYFGFGVWALIAQDLFNNIVDTIVLWFTVKWRPKKLFSWARLKVLFSFGWKLLVSALIENIYNNLRSLIIGKKYSSEDLAQYNRGRTWPNMLITNVNSSIDSILLPSLSNEQDNVETVKMMVRRSMKTSTFVMAPMLMGLAGCGKSLISLVITDKWLPSYPFMVIFCITYMFYPVHTANLNAIKAMGRSDIFLKLEIIKKIVGIVAILVTFRISVMAMAYSLLVTSVLSQIINSWPNKKLMNYSYLEQLKDILPGIGLAVFMGVCVYCVNFLHLSNWLTLLIQVPLGAVIYIGLSALLKLESFTYCWDMAKPVIDKVFHKNNSTEIVDWDNKK